MSEPEIDLLAALEPYDETWWTATTERLLWHANNKIKARRWRGVRGGPAPKGVQPNDLVQTVFSKLMSGQRRWNPESHPDLLEWLTAQIDSEISNLVRSSENRVRRLVSEQLDDEGEERVLDPVDPDASPLDVMLATEIDKQGDQFVMDFIDHLSQKKDPKQRQMLLDMVEAIVDGNGDIKPADLAQRCNVPVTEIYNRKKQLQRELESFMATTTSGPGPRKGGTARAR